MAEPKKKPDAAKSRHQSKWPKGSKSDISTLDFQFRLLEAIERNTEAQLEAARAYRDFVASQETFMAPKSISSDIGDEETYGGRLLSKGTGEDFEFLRNLPEDLFKDVDWGQ